MKLAWITDPHFNFISDEAMEGFVRQNLTGNHADFFGNVSGKPDFLLIGGDIGEAHNIVKYLQMLCNHGVKILFVTGNHDYYGSSFEFVRDRIIKSIKGHDDLIWLDQKGVIEITPNCGLIGNGSWADGRYGDWEGSRVVLSDYNFITDLAYVSKRDQLTIIQKIAQKAADHIRENLKLAFKKYNNVYLLTHVPPWREAAVNRGKPSDDDWAPHFTCKVVGDTITDFMKGHKGKLTVLCGHSHGKGDYFALPNVHVITGDAKYGSPKVNQVFDVV